MLKGPKTIDSHYSYSALITDNDQFISLCFTWILDGGQIKRRLKTIPDIETAIDAVFE